MIIRVPGKVREHAVVVLCVEAERVGPHIIVRIKAKDGSVVVVGHDVIQQAAAVLLHLAAGKVKAGQQMKEQTS